MAAAATPLVTQQPNNNNYTSAEKQHIITSTTSACTDDPQHAPSHGHAGGNGHGNCDVTVTSSSRVVVLVSSRSKWQSALPKVTFALVADYLTGRDILLRVQFISRDWYIMTRYDYQWRYLDLREWCYHRSTVRTTQEISAHLALVRGALRSYITTTTTSATVPPTATTTAAHNNRPTSILPNRVLPSSSAASSLRCVTVSRHDQLANVLREWGTRLNEVRVVLTDDNAIKDDDHHNYNEEEPRPEDVIEHWNQKLQTLDRHTNITRLTVMMHRVTLWSYAQPNFHHSQSLSIHGLDDDEPFDALFHIRHLTLHTPAPINWVTTRVMLPDLQSLALTCERPHAGLSPLPHHKQPIIWCSSKLQSLSLGYPLHRHDFMSMMTISSPSLVSLACHVIESINTHWPVGGDDSENARDQVNEEVMSIIGMDASCLTSTRSLPRTKRPVADVTADASPSPTTSSSSSSSSSTTTSVSPADYYHVTWPSLTSLSITIDNTYSPGIGTDRVMPPTAIWDRYADTIAELANLTCASSLRVLDLHYDLLPPARQCVPSLTKFTRLTHFSYQPSYPYLHHYFDDHLTLPSSLRYFNDHEMNDGDRVSNDDDDDNDDA